MEAAYMLCAGKSHDQQSGKRYSVNQQTKATLRTITTALVIVAIIFAFLISGLRLFGFQVYGVLSGSMEPSYPVGSLVYVKAVDPEDLKIRDVITYSVSPKTVVTHRIVEIVPDDNNPYIKRFRTKGDANNDVDAALVGAADIIGRVSFCIPHLGNVASYIQQPPGIYVAIVLGIVLVGLVVITDSATGEKNKEQNGNRQQNKDKPNINIPWLSALLVKLGIQKPKNNAPSAQPVNRQGYVPGQAQPARQQYPQQGYQYPQQQYPQQGYQYPQQQNQQQGYQYPQQQYPQQGYQYPQQQYPQQGYQYPQQQYPQQGYQYPQQQYPQQGWQYPQQQYPQQGQAQYPRQQYPQQGYAPQSSQQPAAQAAPQQNGSGRS